MSKFLTLQMLLMSRRLADSVIADAVKCFPKTACWLLSADRAFKREYLWWPHHKVAPEHSRMLAQVQPSQDDQIRVLSSWLRDSTCVCLPSSTCSSSLMRSFVPIKRSPPLGGSGSCCRCIEIRGMMGPLYDAGWKYVRREEPLPYKWHQIYSYGSRKTQ